jgi:hypothetical protein
VSPSTASHCDCRSPPLCTQLGGDPNPLGCCSALQYDLGRWAQVTALDDLSWETAILILTRPKQEQPQHITGLT